jgi:hypothetical protein
MKLPVVHVKSGKLKEIKRQKAGGFHANTSQEVVSPCCQQYWKLLNALHSDEDL